MHFTTVAFITFASSASLVSGAVTKLPSYTTCVACEAKAGWCQLKGTSAPACYQGLTDGSGPTGTNYNPPSSACHTECPWIWSSGDCPKCKSVPPPPPPFPSNGVPNSHPSSGTLTTTQCQSSYGSHSVACSSGYYCCCDSQSSWNGGSCYFPPPPAPPPKFPTNGVPHSHPSSGKSTSSLSWYCSSKYGSASYSCASGYYCCCSGGSSWDGGSCQTAGDYGVKKLNSWESWLIIGISIVMSIGVLYWACTMAPNNTTKKSTASDNWSWPLFWVIFVLWLVSLIFQYKGTMEHPALPPSITVIVILISTAVIIFARHQQHPRDGYFDHEIFPGHGNDDNCQHTKLCTGCCSCCACNCCGGSFYKLAIQAGRVYWTTSREICNFELDMQERWYPIGSVNSASVESEATPFLLYTSLALFFDWLLMFVLHKTKELDVSEQVYSVLHGLTWCYFTFAVLFMVWWLWSLCTRKSMLTLFRWNQKASDCISLDTMSAYSAMYAALHTTIVKNDCGGEGIPTERQFPSHGINIASEPPAMLPVDDEHILGSFEDGNCLKKTVLTVTSKRIIIQRQEKLGCLETFAQETSYLVKDVSSVHMSHKKDWSLLLISMPVTYAGFLIMEMGISNNFKIEKELGAIIGVAGLLCFLVWAVVLWSRKCTLIIKFWNDAHALSRLSFRIDHCKEADLCILKATAMAKGLHIGERTKAPEDVPMAVVVPPPVLAVPTMGSDDPDAVSKDGVELAEVHSSEPAELHLAADPAEEAQHDDKKKDAAAAPAQESHHDDKKKEDTVVSF